MIVELSGCTINVEKLVAQQCDQNGFVKFPQILNTTLHSLRMEGLRYLFVDGFRKSKVDWPFVHRMDKLLHDLDQETRDKGIRTAEFLTAYEKRLKKYLDLGLTPSALLSFFDIIKPRQEVSDELFRWKIEAENSLYCLDLRQYYFMSQSAARSYCIYFGIDQKNIVELFPSSYFPEG